MDELRERVEAIRREADPTTKAKLIGELERRLINEVNQRRHRLNQRLAKEAFDAYRCGRPAPSSG